MLSTRIARAGLTGLLLLSLSATAPGVIADGDPDGSSVSGSAQGTGDGGGVTSSSSSPIIMPVVKVRALAVNHENFCRG